MASHTTPANRTIHVSFEKIRMSASTPPWFDLAHRHYEKAPPAESIGSHEFAAVVPLDLLRMVGIPEHIIDDIESIELLYEKPKPNTAVIIPITKGITDAMDGAY